MEMKSPPPCPPTVTIRRNPPRRARATPASTIPLRQPLSSPSLSRDIFSTELPLPQNPVNSDNKSSDTSPKTLSENLKVYLRIRPLTVQKNCKIRAESKNVWPKNPKIKGNPRPKAKKCSEVCVDVNEDLRSVTVSTPQVLQETKRIKSEVYEGFSRVFASEASQNDVFEEMMKPLVEDFLKGKSGMLAAMGPSGSGKTHTVFGCAKEPGMVPIALGRIFSEDKSGGKKCSRLFYLSMFEISSEKGKAERMIDLLQDRSDVCMQQSVLKGVQEALVCDAQQAESLIAYGMLKRATAMTNSNSQSSRSQCIITIRYDSEKGDEKFDGKASSTMLTIIDLAGAEREKKTGNQGSRLLESNFINNTSMVFGLCLRSLLEHQKNRNKPLQKHYQNSLLTRYMRDYLEGKKRMMLILTVKPGVEDYLDTSFLLRQAAPLAKIKFKALEDPVSLTCNKRPNQAFPRAEQLKKMKFSNSGTSLVGEGIIDRDFHFMPKEIARNVDKDCLNENAEGIYGESLDEIQILSDGFVGCGIQEKLPLNGDSSEVQIENDREYRIMQGLSKAMWSVLKQYKKKLEVVETENCHLRDSLTNEKTRSQYLENELMGEKMRFLDLENELKELKSQCICTKVSADTFPVSGDDTSSNLSQLQMIELHELNSDVSSYSLKELDQSESEKKIDSPQLENLLEFIGDSEGEEDFKDTSTVDMCSTSQELLISTTNTHDLICCEDKDIVNIASISEVTSQLISVCQLGDLPEISNNSEGEKGFKDTITEDVCSRSKELSTSTNNAQDLICCDEVTSQMTSACQMEDLLETSGDSKGEKDINDTITVDMCSRSQELSTSSNNTEGIICCEDKGRMIMSCGKETSSELTSACHYTSHKSEEDAINNAGDANNLEPDIESISNTSSFDTPLKCGSAKGSQYHDDVKGSTGESTQLDKGAIDCDPSLVEDQIVSVAAHSQTAINSSGTPQKDDISSHVDEEQLHDKEHKEQLDPPVAVLPKQECDMKNMPKFVPKQECDAQNMPKFVPKLPSCSNFQHTEKPKRRLQPASSVLLKDISILDIKDDNDKPKGGRGGGKTVAKDDKNRTQGSLSLLNLLTSNLKR